MGTFRLMRGHGYINREKLIRILNCYWDIIHIWHFEYFTGLVHKEDNTSVCFAAFVENKNFDLELCLYPESVEPSTLSPTSSW